LKSPNLIGHILKQKSIIYQLLPRLFGNKVQNLVPWGTIEENGVGKFEDITSRALEGISELGVSHIWLTGVLRHAKVNDYSEYGIPGDHPFIVKGRAGSPYAIKDYYDVDPDLAVDPSGRMCEFEQLISRIHQAGMKVIIDLVPNHVARQYHSKTKPEGVTDFGEKDDPTVEYSRHNDFYYIPGEAYKHPHWADGFQPLGGRYDENLEPYSEFPARWTGNGSRSSQPNINDWYETVKINYGITPEGEKDFPVFPHYFAELDPASQVDFWNEHPLPASWRKWREIAEFWLAKGIDGFRYDMAQLVPLAFWNFLNGYIKERFPETLLIAEIYQPDLFDDFIRIGKMDLLYDKVDLYDTLKRIIRNEGSCQDIFPLTDCHYHHRDHLLHFLENHDEQRIASNSFAGDPFRAMPAVVLSATLDPGAFMLYFGQEIGEPAAENPGFGSKTRTSIFDYVHVPYHQRWMNGGHFDGGQLNENEKSLRDQYAHLLNFVRESPAILGGFYDLHRHNTALPGNYNGRVLYSFARYLDHDKVLIICHFDKQRSLDFRFELHEGLIKIWQLKTGNYSLKDELSEQIFTMQVEEERAWINIHIHPLQSLILNLERNNS